MTGSPSGRLSALVPRTLTARLVITTVALVALVGILVTVSATLAMRALLTDRLDNQVRSALDRASGRPIRDSDGPLRQPLGQGPGTLIAVVPAGSSDTAAVVLAQDRPGVRPLAGRALDTLGDVPADRTVRGIRVAGNHYRVVADDDPFGNRVIVGLPTGDIDETLSSMVAWFAMLTILGVGIAGVGGTWLVRRQLRPLHAVAATAREVTGQDLATGDAATHSRVPDELVDDQTEAGRVGMALNTLLDHVDRALTARHRSEQQVRQFVADASHELRTPLATIHGYAELSRRTPDDPSALLTALGKVETEAGRMSGLVEDLLLLARLDAGRPLERADVDLTRLLLESVADARVVAPGHRWQLQLPDEPLTLVGDAARLHQVVSNLLANARAHTPDWTTVTVSAAYDGDDAVVRVHDDGPGLPEELVAHAFERFTRGDSSRTRTAGGAGLGLSLVQAIAVAHGGTAEVQSRRGDTTFVVRLPRGGAPVPEPVPEPVYEEPEVV